ncbi:MAG: AI-2E family transporter, partial [Clostridia bacterium]|nr:AI-2E family transporter [Clostridia bacterium]
FGFDDRKKKIFTISAVVYAVLILLVVVITNFDRFSGFFEWLGGKIAVLSPLVIGAIIAYISFPLVRFFQSKVFKNMENKRWRRTLSIVLTYISILLFLFIFVILILPQLISSIEDLIKKVTDGTYLNATINGINEFLNKVLSFGGDEVFEYISMEKVTKIVSEFFAGTGNLLQNIANLAISYGTNVLTGFKNFFIGFLLSIYFVVSKDRLKAQAVRACAAIFTKKRNEAILDWFRFAHRTFGGFIVGKLIDAIMVIILCSIVFSIARIPFAVLIAVFIGACNVIPFFGPFIGAIPSGFIVFIASPDKLLLFIILTLVVQQFDANFLEPKIVGDRTGMSSLGVLVAVTVMSGYFGIVGAFLGVPIFAVICASLRKNIKKRLRAKDMPTDIAEYYGRDALSEPREESENLSSKLFRVSGTWLKKRINRRKDRAQKKADRLSAKQAKKPTVSPEATEASSVEEETQE